MVLPYTRIANTAKLSKEEWRKLRRSYLGGSDAAASIGLNSYRSPLDVVMDKKGGREIEETRAMWLGNQLEQTVADLFTKETGWTVRKNNGVLISKEYPWMMANIDREVRTEDGKTALLECKTTRSWNKEQWKDGKMPLSYELQCMHYLAVTGAEKCYLACLIGLEDFVIREIERDEETIRLLVDSERDFWKRCIEGEELPDPDGSSAYTKALSDRFSKGDQEEILDLSTALIDMEEYFKVSDLLKQLSEQKEQIEQEIKLRMGDHQTAQLRGAQATWKPVTSRRFDSTRFKKENPDVYQDYSKASTARRFVVKREEQEERA